MIIIVNIIVIKGINIFNEFSLTPIYKYLKDNIYEVTHINNEREMREILEEKDKKEKLRTKNTPLREDLHLIGKTGKE